MLANEQFSLWYKRKQNPQLSSLAHRHSFAGMSNHVDVGLTFGRVTHANSVMQVPGAQSQTSTEIPNSLKAGYVP